MVRPSDWSPVDMDADPTPGHPEEVRDLADGLQTFADDVGEALGRIRGMAEDRAVMDWAGLSAEAFRSEFDDVPGNLEKLQTSYDMAAQALQTYWPKLETAQGMADRALDRAIAAQADLSSAQAALTDAQDWVSRAGDEADRLEREGEREGIEPPSEAEVRAATRDASAANQAASDAQGRVDAAEEALSAARDLARQAKEMREDAARTCAAAIDEASDAGIQNRRWWEDAIHWVSENWDTIVEICKVVVAVLGIVVMIIGGPLAWVVLAAALVVLADTLYRYANGEASLWDVAFAALDCIPGMKGLTTLGGLARGLRSVARTGLQGLRHGALGLGRQLRHNAVEFGRRVLSRDPVDFATGEVVMPARDVELPGVLPLVLERHHVSSYRDGRWFGPSWASTFDQRLVLDGAGVRLFTADGMTLVYPVPLADPEASVLPVEGPRWGLSWDGTPGAPMTVHQPENGRTLHFASVTGRAGWEMPLVAITDRNENGIRFEYDQAGAPRAVLHDGGYHLGVTTDGDRITELRLLSDLSEPLLVRFGYGERRTLTRVYNSSGLPSIFEYDERSRLTRWEDRNGTWYGYEYDGQGRCVAATGTDQVLEYRYRYAPEDFRTTAVNSLGHATVYQFNDSYQLVSETDPLGHVTRREFDRYDRPLSSTDPLGRTTRFTYDDLGQLAVVTRPDGSLTRTRYDEQGRPIETVEADGATWQHAYDERGNRTVVVDPLGHRTRYAYDDRGALVAVTDALGNTTRMRVNAVGLPVAVTDPQGETTHHHRDAFGRPALVVDPLGAETRTDWSVDGRPLRRVDPLGGVETWEWDPEGNLIRHADTNGEATRYTYGPFDVPTSQTQAGLGTYAFHRDTELRLTQVVDPAGRTWDYTYDEAGRLTTESDFDRRVTSYTHDATGQTTSRTVPTGQSITYAYDVLGRLVEKTTSDGYTTRYSHDAAGRLVTATAPDMALSRDYDAVGNLLAETVNGRTLTLTYDAAGQLTSRRTPSGHLSTWTFDPAGRPLGLTSGGRSLAFDHDPNGLETARRIGTTLTLNHSWNSASHLTEQTLTAQRDREPARVLHQRRYAYRQDGYLVSVADLAGTTRYALDQAGRVTEVTAPGSHETYTYDVTGNQTAAHWSGHAPGGDADAVGERVYAGTAIASAGRVHYEHDGAGRVVVRRKSRLSKKPDVWRYSWDAEDRLSQVTTPDGTVWRYVYDPYGRRIAKQRLSADTGSVAEEVTFTWHGGSLIEQTTKGNADSTAAAASLTWDYHGLHPVAQTESRSGGSDGEEEQGEVDRRFFAIITDLVGTPTHLMTEDGRTAWRSQATLCGLTATAPASDADTPLRFPGQYADAETGWHYNVQRHYDPATARYATIDPLGLAPAPNAYTYPHNPMTWIDPLGLAPYIHASVAFQDWATKGAHIHVGTREVRIFPNHLGGIGGRPIRLANGNVASARDVQRALDEIANNPGLRQDLINKATSVRDAMNAGEFGMNVNRASEMHFLIQALERM